MKLLEISLNIMAKNKSDVFIICGERSGDLHGSQIVKKLLSEKPNLKIHCWGGELMEKAGATVLENYRTYNIMGFIEVLFKLNHIYKKISLCKSHIIDYNPKVILLIDFPGFNLKIAKFSKINGFKVHYFIPPKAWAWNKIRAKTMSRYVDKIYSILPFEVDFFRKYNCNISYVGNPLISQISEKRKDKNNFTNTISLLPGSRESELKYSLPIFKKIIEELKGYDFKVCGVNNLNKQLYSDINKFNNVTLFFDKTYDVVSSSNISIVMSGTASLEVSLLNIPQIVVYKASWISYLIAKIMVKIKYISLVNLILNKRVVPELIQNDFNHNNVIFEINKMNNKLITSSMLNDYSLIRKKIGNKISENEVYKILEKDL